MKAAAVLSCLNTAQGFHKQAWARTGVPSLVGGVNRHFETELATMRSNSPSERGPWPPTFDETTSSTSTRPKSPTRADP